MKINTYSFLTNPDRIKTLLGELAPLLSQLGRKFIIVKYNGTLREFKLEVDYDTNHVLFERNTPNMKVSKVLDGISICTDKKIKSHIKPTFSKTGSVWWSFGETEYAFKHRYTWKA